MVYATRFSAMFFLVFAVVIGAFIFLFIKAILQWGRNNNSPVLSVPAVAVAKRIYNAHESSSQYYVTFQFESGDRAEFSVNGRQFGMIAEQDFGKLTFQGKRLISFERV